MSNVVTATHRTNSLSVTGSYQTRVSGGNCMSIASALGSIKAAIDTLGKLREITKSMQNADLKSTIAQHANQLADTQLKLADLKQDLVSLKEEKELLENQVHIEKFSKKYGCNVFEGDDELYCPGCYASKRKKSPTTRLNSRFRKCTVCSILLGD